MDYVRHEAAFDRKAADGSSERAHFEEAARRGDESARRALQGPEFPESVRYLHEMFAQLNTMRSFSEAGPQAIGAETLRAADALFDWSLRPHEAEALSMLDVAWRVARLPEPEKAPEDIEPTPAWPVKHE